MLKNVAMPRKQNGFGSPKSFAFKGVNKYPDLKPKAYGYYPSDRRYGSSVHRTVIETWNLDSNWAKWRKGFEMWNQALYSRLRVENPDWAGLDPLDRYVDAQLVSILYQGTEYPTTVLFDGYEYPTKDSDVGTHYVAKRTPLEVDPDTGAPVDISLGVVTDVFNNELLYPMQKAYREIWVKGTPNERGRLLLQMVNERLTDGETEATLKYLLTAPTDLCVDGAPAIYYGQTAPKDIRDNSAFNLNGTQVTISIPLTDIELTEQTRTSHLIDQGLNRISIAPAEIELPRDAQSLVGKVIYVPDFFKDRLVSDFASTIWFENEEFMAVDVVDTEAAEEVFCLDPGVSQLPPSMYDIATLPSVFKAKNATYSITGTYIFQKSDYQRFFGINLLSAGVVEDSVETASYSVLPFIIQQVDVRGDQLFIKSGEFNSELYMYPPLTADGVLIFDDRSFIKTPVYQPEVTSRDKRFDYEVNTNVDPWMDEIFVKYHGQSNPIKPAITYTCSCPSHSKSILAAPQSQYDQGTRKRNRQKRYPLPTALGQDRFYGSGAQSAAGKITSWESQEDKQQYRICKHTVAAMFADRYKFLEPSQYPTTDERKAFSDKLADEIAGYSDAFRESFERGGISLTEIVFALAQGLNLDNVETAYVVLNSN